MDMIVHITYLFELRILTFMIPGACDAPGNHRIDLWETLAEKLIVSRAQSYYILYWLLVWLPTARVGLSNIHW